MWIEKLAHGVVRVETPLGPRYVQPNLIQRAILLWTFRNFASLPQQVLSSSESRLIDRLWGENRFVSVPLNGGLEKPVIGTIERRAPARLEEVEPARRPMSSANSAVAEQGREAASA